LIKVLNYKRNRRDKMSQNNKNNDKDSKKLLD